MFTNDSAENAYRPRMPKGSVKVRAVIPIKYKRFCIDGTFAEDVKYRKLTVDTLYENSVEAASAAVAEARQLNPELNIQGTFTVIL